MKITGKIEITNEGNMALMARAKDKQYQLGIIDPPYGVGININMGRRKGDKKSNYHKFAGEDKSIPTAEFFKELFRVCENVIIWGGNYMTEHLPPSPCWLLWDKGFSEDVTFAQFEMAWTSFNSSAKKFDKHPSQQNRIHPTQKPVALYKWLLDKYAKEGDKILDTHLGSMSIAIACHDYGYHLTGCELDEDYYNKGIQRVKNHVSQQRLF